MKKILLLSLIFLNSVVTANSKTLNCGPKEITLSGEKIVKIVHEDGTIHRGNVSKNWKYDGSSITHKYIGDRLICGGEGKSREEKISDRSNDLLDTRNRGYTYSEALLLRDYTANLMQEENECYLVIDAAKSKNQPDKFYIDCASEDGLRSRHWVGYQEISSSTNQK